CGEKRNFQAFLANAFFTAGMVIFEVPTGIIADRWGRRESYLLGTITLTLSTILYLFMWHVHGPFWGWAASSILLGLGFTFFSGALEAWLVDALHATRFRGSLEGVFAKGQIAGGIAMLAGSLAGGIIAQLTNLGVPYILRALILLVNFATAFFLMRDLGFRPKKSGRPLREMKGIFSASLRHGLGNAPVRWIMLAAPFAVGTSFYVFYALQPFLLELYGDEKAYGIAGLVAVLIAAAQIAGGFLGPHIRGLFRNRTGILMGGTVLAALFLVMVSLTRNFWAALLFIFFWGLIFAAMMPIRQAYINGLIPSKQRATVLSFDSLMGSSGGIAIQPALGKAADVWSYSFSYLIAAFIQLAALPFIILARLRKAKSDRIGKK
ncbi:MAG TPA: MFS transporter, partial [Candidatus Nanoarchaeia archaeon]|nr:MFS transporter [Candidatus Nanoarchaeia archaeon]